MGAENLKALEDAIAANPEDINLVTALNINMAQIGELINTFVALEPQALAIAVAMLPDSPVVQLAVKYLPLLMPILKKWEPILAGQ